MPVTINEMVITVSVIPDTPTDRSVSSSSSAGNAEGEKRALAEQCLEQMMEVINNKNER